MRLRGSRLPAVGLGSGMLALSTAIGVRVRTQTPRMDIVLHDLVVHDRSPALVDVARVITQGGSTTVVWPAIAVAALAFPTSSGRARWITSAAVAGGAAAGIGVRLLLSEVLQRSRPPATDWATSPGGYSFPSGHTTAATIGAGLLAWALSRHLRRREARAAVWAVAVIWAGGVGLTRVVLGVHWPLDVVGGWLLGTGWLLGMAAALAATPLQRPDPLSP
jgi:membrane-associated phospholipid phosphatase